MSVLNPDQHSFDLGIPKLAANGVELIQIAGRTDANALVVVVIDRNSLLSRLDAEQRKICPHPFGVCGSRE